MTSRYSQKTLGSYKRTFNQALLQITERTATGSGSTGSMAKVSIASLVTLVASALANKYLGLSLLP